MIESEGIMSLHYLLLSIQLYDVLCNVLDVFMGKMHGGYRWYQSDLQNATKQNKYLG